MGSTSKVCGGATCAVALLLAGSVSAEDWHPFSRNSDRVYLADVAGIVVAGEVTTMRIARVTRKPSSATDYTHVIDAYEFRCLTNKVKAGETVEYGADGTESDRYDDSGDWEDVRADTLDDYAKAVACDGNRANPPTWPTLQAFMDAGRN